MQSSHRAISKTMTGTRKGKQSQVPSRLGEGPVTPPDPSLEGFLQFLFKTHMYTHTLIRLSELCVSGS